MAACFTEKFAFKSFAFLRGWLDIFGTLAVNNQPEEKNALILLMFFVD
jgi:hypothetical protein